MLLLNLLKNSSFPGQLNLKHTKRSFLQQAQTQYTSTT